MHRDSRLIKPHRKNVSADHREPGDRLSRSRNANQANQTVKFARISIRAC
jgi:hypothetical protein